MKLFTLRSWEYIKIDGTHLWIRPGISLGALKQMNINTDGLRGFEASADILSADLHSGRRVEIASVGSPEQDHALVYVVEKPRDKVQRNTPNELSFDVELERCKRVVQSRVPALLKSLRPYQLGSLIAMEPGEELHGLVYGPIPETQYICTWDGNKLICRTPNYSGNLNEQLERLGEPRSSTTTAVDSVEIQFSLEDLKAIEFHRLDTHDQARVVEMARKLAEDCAKRGDKASAVNALKTVLVHLFELPGDESDRFAGFRQAITTQLINLQ